MKKTLLLKKGATILEVVIAATLISLAVIAALSLVSSTQKETTYARDLNIATKYNYEAIDRFRQIRTAMGWSSIVNELTLDSISNETVYCLSFLPTSEAEFSALTYGACSESNFINSTRLIRQVTFDLVAAEIASGEVNGIITTIWQGSKEHSVNTEFTLTNH